jgi:hypothetical protein
MDFPHYEAAPGVFATATAKPYSTGADVEMTFPSPDESLHRRDDGLHSGHTSPLVPTPPLLSSGVHSSLPRSSGAFATAPVSLYSYGADVDTRRTQPRNLLDSAPDTSKEGELTIVRMIMMRS